MFEPHLEHHSNGGTMAADDSGSSLLDELDKLAPIKSFDAFPKVTTKGERVAYPRSKQHTLAAPVAAEYSRRLWDVSSSYWSW